MRNHNRLYTLLNVLPDADPVVIEAAYKALMKRHHPDIRSGGGAAVGERIAAELNQAYQTLRDPDRRAAYDAEEHSRQERHRAELARAFEPPVPRTAPPPPQRPEPARAGQRAAAWIGAAGILMLGGAIYLLAQGNETPVPRAPASSSSEIASASPGQSEQAFRDQPVNRTEVEKALTEFRRIAGVSGIPGAAAYSDHCFDVQSRTRAVADYDHCVAFDHLASRGDLVELSDQTPQSTRFRPPALVARHIRAAETMARDPGLIEARLFEIRRLTDSEVGRLATATPARRPGQPPAVRPLAKAAVQRPPAPKATRPSPIRSQRPTPERNPREQDFLERQGGIY